MAITGIALRVLIVADDPLVRGGLATLLAERPDCMVAGQMATGTDITTGLEVYRPDLVLWDMGWDPALTGTQHASAAGREETKSPLERLTDLCDTGHPVVILLPDATHAAAAWLAGASGLLLRQAQAEQLTTSLRAVMQGLIVIDSAFAHALLPTHTPELGPLVDTLTPRERDVLQLLAEGLPNKTIADRLQISEHTVKFHVNAIMGKLGAQSRTEAVVRATRQGLILL